MKKVLFIDRDGTLIYEPPVNFQVDALEKLSYIPYVFNYLSRIVNEFDYELVMVTNQDGLGTSSFPEDTFWPVQNKMMEAFENEGIIFTEVYIDRTYEDDPGPGRKPSTGMLGRYLSGDYDLANSYVIGDRKTDMRLAENLGSKGILIGDRKEEYYKDDVQVLVADDWKDIYQFLLQESRKSSWTRSTSETNITVELNLNGTGKSDIKTGLNFFDHMLEQIARHGLVDLQIFAKGDLEIDEHHTIEDTAITLGTVFKATLGKKMGIERYGFCLPMDDCLAQVAIDFGGRSWIEWDVIFNREMIGDVPTEMFYHFFKSFCDAAQCNLNVKAEGENEHHKIEAVFKAFAKAIKMAVKQDKEKMILPSSKGLL
ncbi:bifunctional histidinol-phosphatase/imidazoleglycerol-phosphate dehydratase HisB [Paracrocinitomix mangrovi]|uniref:bifunctional histidinol-phosphatase/imidazoleglycerol-phosphate dehydratase HisB n=1 Tax=Paracrocinitomix mangrovi TaxID=2862509 RepID=UPI001C8DA182|nr:bifunctional histidinol-phosphatase/imidazoleglycerol-phosphate dehydratase HisB [Paracrocinitomix mangrovi]UKN02293.1 bifunctional histidinol-phosphatase/imidazoleglycerol-phosphate dehydratase HisB [Paracrocinitomix mangrovi]